MALPQTPPTFTAVTAGSEEYSVEINDANFETKAWKSSRYDGSQTKTQVINKNTLGDVTFGLTPAVQKYTRNIYIGNAVIGMDDGGEDQTLINFTNFSYIQTNKSITINFDDTISVNEIETKKNDLDSKIGFYRSFYEDFPIGSDCRIVLLDNTIKSNLQSNYPVYFNGGQLQKLIRFDINTDIGGVGSINDYSGSYSVDGAGTSSIFQYAKESGIISASIAVFNRDSIIQNFFTGSLFESIAAYTQTPDGGGPPDFRN